MLFKLKNLNVRSLYFIKFFLIYNNLIFLKSLLIFFRSFFFLISFEKLTFFESNLSLRFIFLLAI